MIETRTFDGDPQELSAFCMRIWRERYAGHTAIPLWTGPFFDWELFDDGPAAREFLVAAYEGSRLVGVLPARPVAYQWRGERIVGSRGSFLSVDPQYETRGVSLKLWLEQRRRHRQHGAAMMTGYLIDKSSGSMGKEFWRRFHNTEVVRRVGLWARLIDHRAVNAFAFMALDRWGSRISGWFQGPPRKPRDMTGIRPYVATDLSDCLRLAGGQSRAAEFAVAWDEASLGRQLAHKGFPRTIVAEQGGRVGGFVNYFPLGLAGRKDVLAGVIDLLCLDELPSRMRKRMFLAALAQMAEEGCHLSLLLRTPGQPYLLLARTGFLSQPAEYQYIVQLMAPDAPHVKTRRIHAIWR